jgi:two-component system, cell cycle sensor histidine kinase and response regulator CckA
METPFNNPEEFYRTLIEVSPNGIFIQKGCTIIFANHRLDEMLGYHPGELIGLEHWRIYHPNYQKLIRQRVQACLRGEMIPSIHEIKLQRKDKTCIYGEIDTTPTTIEGEPGIQVWVRDISERKRANEELRKSEKQYRSLFERLPLGLFRSTPDGRFLDANPAFTSLVRCPDLETLLNTPATAVYSVPEERMQWRKFAERQGGSPAYETQWKTLNGTTIWVRESARAIKDAEGNVLYYEGAAEDITEHKQAEEALRTSEEKYRTILGTIKEGYYETDLQGNFTFFNDSLCEILGYFKDELLGLNYRKLASTENAKDVYQAFNQIYRTGNPLLLINYEIVRKDGQKKYIELSGSLRMGDKGQPIGFYGIIRDITDRKQAEKEIEKRQKFLESVLYNASDGIVTLDASHHITDWNPGAEQIFGYTHDEAIGRNLDELITRKKAVDEAKLLTRHVLSGNKITPREIVRYRKDGTDVNVIVSGSPIIIDGELQGVVAIYIDITEIKQAEEEKKRLGLQLQHAQKMEAIGTLSAGMAHNFNNLLMAIQGNASLMLLKTDPRHPNYVRLKNIEKAVESGSKLNSQLLGYAREGRYEVRLLDINQLITETLDTFAVTKPELRLHRELAEDIWTIMGDKGQLDLVMLNLFLNAADAMPGGGNFFVKTEKATHQNMNDKPYTVTPGNYVLITLRDTGVGMDEKTMERIFDPFFTTKGLLEGTGLGLASVYGIIKAHKGYIDVKSKKGQGTTFSIYLPASGKKLREEHERSSEIMPGTETVLLVDDEEMVLDVGSKMLETLGYRVLTARGGKEAIDVYRENIDSICIVILDMIMPDGGGDETYERLKEINPAVRVLLSSGYSIKDRVHQIMLRGCDSFIQKPFRMKSISQKIREILDK